ncbi:hypothetical protein [Aquabacterium sp. J223]|uniref:hypothetical protein n=1 Tax=Aquabacterium sp. J223 TaxID=2898431 RepID=UPI0021AD7174|nr:hypothetical protein [Aquabacterium sp. J223]UUX94226.1 hypothetical protein LRS07_12885 [Aquabacterium sp. J223]
MYLFEHQNSRQTLEEGIAEYSLANAKLARDRTMSPEAKEFFRCHDAAHVIFGCGNTLEDEAVVKIASIFGTSGGFGVLGGYRLHESFEIYMHLGARDVLRSIVKSVFLVPLTILQCFRQRRRWPWNDFEMHVQVPLQDIREEFGIRVAHYRRA